MVEYNVYHELWCEKVINTKLQCSTEVNRYKVLLLILINTLQQQEAQIVTVVCEMFGTDPLFPRYDQSCSEIDRLCFTCGHKGPCMSTCQCVCKQLRTQFTCTHTHTHTHHTHSTASSTHNTGKYCQSHSAIACMKQKTQNRYIY